MGNNITNIVGGDSAGLSLAQSGLSGEVFVWHDVLYDGVRKPGWPDEETIEARAAFLEDHTAGGMTREFLRKSLLREYSKLEAIAGTHIILWFDACLFDQAMLAHILACLSHLRARHVELICVDSFPGVEPFHGLGQLSPEQFVSLEGRQLPVSEQEFEFAIQVDKAFATSDFQALEEISRMSDAPLPFVPAAAARWLQERPDPETGLGLLESLVMSALRNGCNTPLEIFKFAASADTPPQFWGDSTMWAKINGLAMRNPPLLKIEGPTDKLPQRESNLFLESFLIKKINADF